MLRCVKPGNCTIVEHPFSRAYYFYSITFMFSGDRAFHADIDFAFDLLPTNPKLVGLSTISTTAIISRSIWNRHKML